MNIWFSSDFHYGHKNIAGPAISKWKSGFRNFKSLSHMNDTIVNNINSVVKQDDILYFLGDWSFGDIETATEFRNRIICKNIHLIIGNHDKISDEFCKLFSTVSSTFSGWIGKSYFHLSHYSHRVWPKSHHGSIHLFGHSHGSLPPHGKSMDVGIDCHPKFRPFNIGEIINIMNGRTIEILDHHE